MVCVGGWINGQDWWYKCQVTPFFSQNFKPVEKPETNRCFLNSRSRKKKLTWVSGKVKSNLLLTAGCTSSIEATDMLRARGSLLVAALAAAVCG